MFEKNKTRKVLTRGGGGGGSGVVAPRDIKKLFW